MLFAEIDYIGIYNVNKFKNNTLVSKKRPTIMFEFDFCVEDGGIAFVDDKAIPIRKNTIICAKPGQKRHTKLPLNCYYMHFDVNNDELRNILLNLPDAFMVENEEAYKKIFINAQKYFKRNSKDCEIVLEGLILTLIYRLKRDAADVPSIYSVPSKQAETIKTVVQYIKEHLNEDLSLETLAKRFSFSPIHFHNSFKEVMSKTLRVFVEERRIKKSIDLLLTTSIPLSEIAYQCGFSSQSYFCYVFKRHTGSTPKDMQKTLLQKYENT